VLHFIIELAIVIIETIIDNRKEELEKGVYFFPPPRIHFKVILKGNEY
jgi:hypothetical protein